MSPITPPLCVADDVTFWPWFTSPTLESWPDREHAVVVLPIVGLADWGLGHALDAEETVLLPILREASRLRSLDLDLLVVPPLRFVFGVDPGCAFAVELPAAHALIAEVVASIASAGFERIVLLNASPWNEEVCAAASRDLRIKHDIQMFRINLAAVGLDFHPQRSPDRRRVQTFLTALTGHVPEAVAAAAPALGWGEESVHPLEGTPVALPQAQSEGKEILAAAAGRLLALLNEIQDRPPLVHQFND